MIKAERGKMNDVKTAVTELKAALDNIAGQDYNSGNVMYLKDSFKNVNYSDWTDPVKDSLQGSLEDTSVQLDTVVNSFDSGNFNNIRKNTDLILQTIGYYEEANDKFMDCDKKIKDPANEGKDRYLSDLKESRSNFSSQLFHYIDVINEYLERYKTYDFEGNANATVGDVSSLADGNIADLPEEKASYRDPQLDQEWFGGHHKVYDDGIGLTAYDVGNDGYLIIYQDPVSGKFLYFFVNDPNGQFNDGNIGSYIESCSFLYNDTVVVSNPYNKAKCYIPIVTHSDYQNSISDSSINAFINDSVYRYNKAQESFQSYYTWRCTDHVTYYTLGGYNQYSYSTGYVTTFGRSLTVGDGDYGYNSSMGGDYSQRS
jgi:hypothetical protein